jgi:hypothetical protein
MLPMGVIWYAFDLAYGAAESPGVNGNNARSRVERSLESSLENLGVDLPRKLAFVRQAFVVQPREVASKITGHKGISSLYITEAIPNLGGRIVAILSSSSPEDTSIFTIDDRLNANLVYDSINANRFANDKHCDPLGQITSVRVSREGLISLEETNVHWSSKHSRTFELDLNGQTPALRCTDE